LLVSQLHPLHARNDPGAIRNFVAFDSRLLQHRQQ
jgi:hypothetical protein